jgi:HlyD family secretion protein
MMDNTGRNSLDLMAGKAHPDEGKFGKGFKRGLMAVILLALAAGAGVWWHARGGESRISYTTEKAILGNLVVRVMATGNLQPTTQVDVGSELSGIISEVLANDNDQVKKGQVLARLDSSKLEDQVLKSEAALKAAQATVQLNKAATKEARINLERLKEAWRLSGGKVPSKNEMTTAEASLDKAIANEASAEAAVLQAEATLSSDRTNVAKAEIKSPIDGIVLLRQIEPGQTVAAS